MTCIGGHRTGDEGKAQARVSQSHTSLQELDWRPEVCCVAGPLQTSLLHEPVPALDTAAFTFSPRFSSFSERRISLVRMFILSHS